MCGISGIINLSNRKKREEKKIQKMNELIKHRGPNSEGYYYDEKVELAHRRLAIFDLSSLGNQPMERGNNIIVYNGEIYNYLEIREELENKGYKFKTNTDTEVILFSYEEWGEECVGKFNGMWAFAIYDKIKEKVFCSRDRFGIKPFYYKYEDNILYFGSEIKQLLKKKGNLVNKEILLTYLTTGLEEYDNSETFFKEIKKLPQGSNLIVNLKTKNINIEEYYNLEKEANKLGKKTIEDYKIRLYESIKLRKQADVVVSTCLSGGLDSSSIATILSETNENLEEIKAIHAKSTEEKNIEEDFAKKIAQKERINLIIIEPSKEEFKKYLDEVIYTQEEPFGSTSIIMQYLVMKKAREIGSIVMLDGQGGDETLLGYERYYSAYLKSFPFYEIPKLVYKIKRRNSISVFNLLKLSFGFSNYNLRKYFILKQSKFVKNKYKKYINFNIIKKNCEAFKNIKKLQIQELTSTQLPHLLKYEDKNSMRNSIETRLPFLDYKLVEIALNIDDKKKMKNGWTKYPLRKSLDGRMDEKITWRKSKLGFASPQKTWLDFLSKEINEKIKASKILNEICEIEKLKIDTLSIKEKWKYYNIAKWEEIFKVEL